MELKPWVAPRSNLSFLPTSPASEALYFLLPLEWGEEFLRLEEEVSQLRKEGPVGWAAITHTAFGIRPV